MKRRFVYRYLIALPLALLACLWLYMAFMPVVSDEKGFVYYLEPGTSRHKMIKELSRQGLIPHPYLFSLYAYTHIGSQLKTGEYLFPTGASQRNIWKQVTKGIGLYQRTFTIVPGWTFAQVRKALSESEGLRSVTAGWSNAQIMESLGYHNVKPEGEFFPETYYYTRDNPDLTLLKRAIDLMQERLTEAWNSRAPDLPYKNEYEALIAASLVEKEAYLASEQPTIAGVLVNRLERDMLLQFDPTVIYGMGERYQGKIHKKDLEQDTPYNTYVRKGLPPTPIGMPGMSAIEAALHPAQHDYLYFVAKGDGGHQFSKSLAEHQQAVEAARNQNEKR